MFTTFDNLFISVFCRIITLSAQCFYSNKISVFHLFTYIFIRFLIIYIFIYSFIHLFNHENSAFRLLLRSSWGSASGISGNKELEKKLINICNRYDLSFSQIKAKELIKLKKSNLLNFDEDALISKKIELLRIENRNKKCRLLAQSYLLKSKDFFLLRSNPLFSYYMEEKKIGELRKKKNISERVILHFIYDVFHFFSRIGYYDTNLIFQFN